MYSKSGVILLVIGFIGLTAVISAQDLSGAYYWEKAELVLTDYGESRTLLEGTTRDFSTLSVTGISLEPGKVGPGFLPGVEGLILVKRGKVTVSVNEGSKSLGPGSAALILPGDFHDIRNAEEEVTEYFMLQFVARSKPTGDLPDQGKSLLLNWDEIEFHSHDKGGVRRYFDRQTIMSNRFEMHATTLNPGLKSHEPHTHRAAEIILMLSGETEEQIGDTFYQGSPGDFYFLESEVPHAIENIGKKPATYYAFQFE